jgi:predicted nucleic acid-binding protein
VNVYVESNFVLELALLQEQHAACKALLDLCTDGRIRLLLPSFSMIEPFGALFRRRAEHKAVKLPLDAALRELGRTASLATPVRDAKVMLHHLLVTNNEDELERWKLARSRIASVAELIPFDERVLPVAVAVEDQFRLTPPDALIYASVRSHLSQTRPPRSCFLNRNFEDFNIPPLITDLQAFGCRFLPAFDQGLSFVLGMLGRN